MTDQGRKYYERTKSLLEEMAQADGEVMKSSLELSGLVRIATPATFGRLHVLPLVPRLLVLHPKLTLDLKLADGVQDLLAQGINLAIRVSPVRSLDSIPGPHKAVDPRMCATCALLRDAATSASQKSKGASRVETTSSRGWRMPSVSQPAAT